MNKCEICNKEIKEPFKFCYEHNPKKQDNTKIDRNNDIQKGQAHNLTLQAVLSLSLTKDSLKEREDFIKKEYDKWHNWFILKIKGDNPNSK